jgi:hypothetical protein
MYACMYLFFGARMYVVLYMYMCVFSLLTKTRHPEAQHSRPTSMLDAMRVYMYTLSLCHRQTCTRKQNKRLTACCMSCVAQTVKTFREVPLLRTKAETEDLDELSKLERECLTLVYHKRLHVIAESLHVSNESLHVMHVLFVSDNTHASASPRPQSCLVALMGL